MTTPDEPAGLRSSSASAGADLRLATVSPHAESQIDQALEGTTSNEHRESIRALLDRALPAESHLRCATQILLNLSTLYPGEITAEARQESLETARLHLERHIAHHSPPMSPTDQLVDRFTRRMHGL